VAQAGHAPQGRPALPPCHVRQSAARVPGWLHRRARHGRRRHVGARRAAARHQDGRRGRRGASRGGRRGGGEHGCRGGADAQVGARFRDEPAVGAVHARAQAEHAVACARSARMLQPPRPSPRPPTTAAHRQAGAPATTSAGGVPPKAFARFRNLLSHAHPCRGRGRRPQRALAGDRRIEPARCGGRCVRQRVQACLARHRSSRGAHPHQERTGDLAAPAAPRQRVNHADCGRVVTCACTTEGRTCKRSGSLTSTAKRSRNRGVRPLVASQVLHRANVRGRTLGWAGVVKPRLGRAVCLAWR